jgi:hypothetical protein
MIYKELLVISKIEFCPNKDNGNTRSIMPELRNPLLGYILIASLANKRESKNENISTTVTQRS